jgi:hypothetical protein
VNDPLVRRVNALVTTFLDLLATLLFAGAVGWTGWVYAGPWAGMVAAGVVVTVLSAVAQHRAAPRRPAPAVVEPEDLPGPTSPGNVHVMGR